MKINKFLKIFLILLVPVFLFGATFLVIIITQGGTVTRQGIVNETGVIRINTDPENIAFSFFLDDKKNDLQNNNSINVSEGEHKIRIEAQNMLPWEKKIIVSKGIVNEVYVKLFASNLALTKVTTSNVDRIFFTKNSEYLFYIVKNSTIASENGIWRFQLSSNNFIFFNQEVKPVKFFETTDTAVNTALLSKYEIYPTNDGNKLLLIDTVNKTSFIISNQQNLNGNTQNIINLNDKVGFVPDSIEWMNFNNSVLIKEGFSLFDYNVNTGVLSVIKYSESTPIIFTSNNSQLIVFDSIKNTLLTYKNLLLTQIKVPAILLTNDIKNLYLASGNDRFLFLETTTKLKLLDLEKFTIQDIGPTGKLIALAPDGLGLLLSDTTNKIISYNIKENIVSNTLEIKTSPIDLTLAEGDILKYIPQSSHLLYFKKLNSKIYAIDKDGSNTVQLIENTNIVNGFNFDNTGSNLFVLLIDETTADLKTSSNIYKINIIKNQ